MAQINYTDQTKGMLVGLAIGDALGVPFEFASFTPKKKYTGLLLENEGQIQFKWASVKIPPGSVSDDSEMTFALLRTLLCDELEYKVTNVTINYMKWANSGTSMMGRNTRALFHNVKTMRGYTNRYNKMMATSEVSQSNGSLMRCSPLIFLSTEEKMLTASNMDVNLSNPNDINRLCSSLYLQVLRKIYYGATREHIRTFLNSQLQEDLPEEVNDALTDALNDDFIRNVSTNKGWVCHAFSISLYAYLNYINYELAMKFIIADHPCSDTDTNACITGALMGCSLGYQKMMTESSTATNMTRLQKYFVANSRKHYGLEDLEQVLNMLK